MARFRSVNNYPESTLSENVDIGQAVNNLQVKEFLTSYRKHCRHAIKNVIAAILLGIYRCIRPIILYIIIIIINLCCATTGRKDLQKSFQIYLFHVVNLQLLSYLYFITIFGAWFSSKSFFFVQCYLICYLSSSAFIFLLYIHDVQLKGTSFS